MPKAIINYVRWVDATNRFIGRIVMWGVFAMMAVLLYSSFMKFFFNPPHWTIEGAQFSLAAYFLLGGGYSMQLASHVRMDLLYGNWTDRTKAWVDVFTILALIFYLCVLLYGGFSSTEYALEYGERSRTLWRPYMWPVKVVMCIGIALMLLQAISEFFKDIAKLRGAEIA